jgi:hypothetical protein
MNVHDIGIVETTYDVGYYTYFPDVGKELIAQAFALGSSGHQTRNIYELDDGWNGFFRLEKGFKPYKPGIRDRDNTFIGLYGAKGVICRFGFGARESRKNG